jgi:NH3-dependent NAD+ synthetase
MITCPLAAPAGTSNKDRLLLGGTLFGDMASAINPLGDLYKHRSGRYQSS